MEDKLRFVKKSPRNERQEIRSRKCRSTAKGSNKLWAVNPLTVQPILRLKVVQRSETPDGIQETETRDPYQIYGQEIRSDLQSETAFKRYK